MLIAACYVVVSCDSDLNIDNPNRMTRESYWKSEEEAIKGVNSIYSTLHRGAISRWMPFYYIVRSDEGWSTSPATDIVNNMDQFVVTDYNYGNAYGIWGDLYTGVFRANQVISNVPDMAINAEVKDRTTGEAYFLRAFFYYNLVSLWGNVPLMLEPSQPEDKPFITPIAGVWAQIEQDLDSAVSNLPAQYSSENLGRATKGAAQTLLAKALMQQHKYDEALTPLRWMVEGEGAGIYDLVDNYRDNFLITTENNKESVFEWQFAINPTEFTDNDAATPNHNYGTSLAQFFGPSGIGWSDGEARRWPIWEMMEETTTTGDRDPRIAASFLYDSTDVGGPEQTMIYGETFAFRYGTNNNRVWFRKFQNDHWKNEEGYRSPNNWRFLRYADVLLMYAACLNEEGQTTEAYQYVDRVRQRAGLAALSTAKPGLSQAAFLEQLKHERVTELSGEGHRWNDLARWGDLGPDLASRDAGFANFEVGKDEILPIPTAEIDLNPNLTQHDAWK